MQLKHLLQTCGNDYKLLKIWYCDNNEQDFNPITPDWVCTRQDVTDVLPQALEDDDKKEELVLAWYFNVKTSDLCVLIKGDRKTT